ncbi:MAG: Uma2 family endonuclease [Caldilineaceae bacterium SB0661_bin_32]|uniref:Uma2 family endonuclease n=1 Tax=Caldilineaceae bacterium SB0661_bin_32 TaxID=2605255 RepID=A0A6B1DDA6_9CHLR|nr:Uma2 family endonuclease [Caldilineaceae bacterium SB0661_bin_32]
MRIVRETVTANYAARSVQLPAHGAWTYDDYALLPDDGKRYEVIRGELYMSAAPRPLHQRVITRLSFFLEGFLENSALGTVFVAPIDVILPQKLGDPVQPDIVVVRRESLHIIDELNIQGAPDLVVEVLSPSSPAHDRNLKYDLYAEAGVQEYWIIDPHRRTVEIHLLRSGAYVQHGKWEEGEAARSAVLEGFTVSVDEIIPA